MPICRELERRPGIFCILAEAVDGELRPGDDVLFLVVAGDIRENVKAVFAELLDRVKAEAVVKQEATVRRIAFLPVWTKFPVGSKRAFLQGGCLHT